MSIRFFGNLAFLSLMLAACGDDLGAYGAAAAMSANQKASAEVLDAPRGGSFSGTSTDNSSTCAQNFDGVAWCENSKAVVFCDAGTWRALACSTVLADSSCGVEEDGSVVCR